jgi:sulfate adenylyltransferase subunit 1
MKHTTKDVRVMVRDVQYKVDIHTLHRAEDDKEIGLNDIGKITVRASKPVFADLYKNNKGTGLVILIDEFTNETVACGMVV